jgi:hypothetical protein
MKNTLKLKAVLRTAGIVVIAAVIGFAMTACDDSGGGTTLTVGTTDGKLTITGLAAAYNGKYVLANGSPGEYSLVAADAIATNGTLTAKEISNGSATLKVWKGTGDTLGNYNGNDQNVMITVLIINKPTLTESEQGQEGTPSWLIDYGTITDDVDFTNGVGTGVFESSLP